MYKSETYVHNLAKGLRDLKERNLACDLTLSSKDGASFTVHRIVMAAASPYFMLKLDNEISSGQIHLLKNVDGQCLEVLVNFAYSGEIDFGSIPKTATWPLLAACTELQMADALSLCHDYLAGNATPSKSSRPARNVQSEHLSIKMEVETHGVKQEGYDDYDQSYDDQGDDDNYPGADDTYYTGDSYEPGEGSPFVKVTALEDDPSLSEEYSEQLSNPPKRKRGRPRKGESPSKRGRTPKKATPTAAASVVQESPAPRKRGRPRKRASPVSVEPKPKTRAPRGRKRKRPVETVQGQACGACGKVVKLKTLLGMHRRIKHYHRTYAHEFHRKFESLNIGSRVVVQPDFETNRNVYGCSRCGEVFNMWTRWRKHYMQRHLRSRHGCIKCKVGFSHPMDLQHHKLRKHKSKILLKKRAGIRLEESTGDSSVRKRGQQWASLLNLPQATTVKSKGGGTRSPVGTRPSAAASPKLQSQTIKVPCRVCGEEFSKKGISCHVRRHFEQKRHQCTHCGKEYSTKRYLREHIETAHEGVKFKCTYENCSREFKRMKCLRRHLKEHEGDFTFRCEICGRGFFANDFYRMHMNSHYGIKAYECGLCGKKYASPSGLTRHLVDCGNARNVECPHCDKMFQSERRMTDHVKDVHVGRKRKVHLCNLCGKVLGDASRLRAHVRRHEDENRKEQSAVTAATTTTTAAAVTVPELVITQETLNTEPQHILVVEHVWEESAAVTEHHLES